MQLRHRRRVVALDDLVAKQSAQAGPEEVLEQHELHDWIWSSVAELTDPLQQVVLLRFFSESASYEEIAAICQVPVGTVRSRLNQAKRKLNESFASLGAASADSARLAELRRQQFGHLLTAADRGEFREALHGLAVPDLEIVGPQEQRARGLDLLVHVMETDLEAGVRERPVDVAASTRFCVIECDLLSPPWDPQHCPAAVLWLLRWGAERIEHIRLFHPRPALTVA
jgi:hypothetical protein